MIVEPEVVGEFASGSHEAFHKIFNYMVENTQQMEVCKLCGELRIQ